MASWRARTASGTTRRSTRPSSVSTFASGSGSGSGSVPPATCIPRIRMRVPSETSAFSSSRWKNDGSLAAIWARIVAIPSSRLSSESRRTCVRASSPRTRTRSSRASSAIAW